MATTVADLPGSHVVVTAEPGTASAIARRAPASVLLVAAGDDVCGSLLAETLFPAPRVVGVTGSAEDVASAAAAVAFDDYSEHDCLVAGAEGYAAARARLGARGVREIL